MLTFVYYLKNTCKKVFFCIFYEREIRIERDKGRGNGKDRRKVRERVIEGGIERENNF
jgi:hypothetical protein